MNRGGLGCIREYRLYGVDDASGYGSCSGARRAPWSLEGGSPGSHNYLEYNQAGDVYRVGRTPKVALADGDRAMVVTAAGGGFGDPLERDPERVLNDVVDGYVSLARACEDYGVVIDPKSMTVDVSATDDLRAERRDVSG
jgi:N-methylhydantoinase B